MSDLRDEIAALAPHDDPPLSVWNDTHCLTTTTVASVARRLAVLETMYGALRHDPLYTVGAISIHEPGTNTAVGPDYGANAGLIGKLRRDKLQTLRQVLQEGVYPVFGRSAVFPNVWLRPCDAWRVSEHQPPVLGQFWGWERDLKWATMLSLPVNRRRSKGVSYMEPSPGEWDAWAAPSAQKTRMLEGLPPDEAREVRMFRTRLVWGWSTICALRGTYEPTGPQDAQWTAEHNETLRKVWDTARARVRMLQAVQSMRGFLPDKPTRGPRRHGAQIPDPVTPATCGRCYEDLSAAQLIEVRDEDTGIDLTSSGLLALMLAEGTYAAGAF